ncbi:MAG: hypothetical protein Q8O40_14360 [Chloroflexota bacterium]|nr:hypothetical protein [Chloroflexota bacterium]
MKLSFLSSLRFRGIVVLPLAIAPLVGLLVWDYADHRREALAQGQEEALRLARLASWQQKEMIDDARTLLAALAYSSPVQSGDAASCQGLVTRLLQENPGYANIGVAAPDGNIFCSAVALNQPFNASERLWFQLANQTRQFAVGEYQIGAITGKSVLVFGQPLTGLWG